MNVLETPGSIPRLMGPTVSGPIAETCKGWDTFTRLNKVLLTGIDSGM